MVFQSISHDSFKEDVEKSRWKQTSLSDSSCCPEPFSYSYDRWRIKTRNSVQDCPNSWCIVKTQDHIERQKHCLQLQNQDEAFLDHLNLLVRVLNMGLYSRVREEDTSYRNKTLPKTSGHLLQGCCYEWRSEERYRACYWAVWRPYHHCEKTQIEMVWAHSKINRTCKDDPTQHCTWREKESQTQKEIRR